MKRVICAMLALMLCVNSFSLYASADDVVADASAVSIRLTDKELVDIACRAFPEYAAKIDGSAYEGAYYTQSSQSADDTVTFQETRSVDDGAHLVTYQEYASGRSLTAIATITYNQTYYGWEGISLYRKGNFFIRHNNWNSTFNIFAFSYTLNDGAYDEITAIGTTELFRSQSTNASVKWTETAASPAHLSYSVVFRNTDTPDNPLCQFETVNVYITVGGDQLYYYVD